MALFSLHLSSILARFGLYFQSILAPFGLHFGSIWLPWGGPGAGARIVLLIPRFWGPFGLPLGSNFHKKSVFVRLKKCITCLIDL